MASGGAAGTSSLELLLPPQVLRNLADRSFDKRKVGAQEVEKILRRYKELGNHGAIRKVLMLIAADFACSTNSNNRKGGLIALASASIGLTSSTADHLDILVPAVLKSFNDAENRVRYYACESLFNIAKVCRAAVLRYFADIFTGMCKLVADSDVEVKNGANLLDRLMKEIVLECEAVDTGALVPLLRAHMGVVNPYVRQLLVGWITALNDVPGVDLVEHMPQLLEGLFDMLADGNKEIRQQAYSALAGCMDQLTKVPTDTFGARVAFRPMVATVIAQTARERDKFNRLTSVEWLTHFLQMGQSQLAPVYDKILGAVLRALSDPEGEIAGEAKKTNGELIALASRLTPLKEMLPVLPAIVRIVTAEARSKNFTTRSAALRWVALLLALAPDQVMPGVEELLGALLSNIADSDDPEVMRLNLEVLARLSVYDISFLRRRVLPELVQLFADNRALLEAKGVFVLRRLCLLLDARTVYLSLAKILSGVSNREFRGLLIEMLHLLLLTAVETSDLRDALRGSCALAQQHGPSTVSGARGGEEATGAAASSSSSSSSASSPGGSASPLKHGGASAGTSRGGDYGDDHDDDDDEGATTGRGTSAAGGVGASSTGGAASASGDGTNTDSAAPSSSTSSAATGDAGVATSASRSGGALAASATGGGGSGTASEKTSARSKSSSGGSGGSVDDPVVIFRRLYKAWVVNPVAAFALCLLTHAYDLGARIISHFGETSVSVSVLMSVDKLVQLLETPIFITTRMHLTMPERPDHAYLLRSLYGLLMLLPQGTAYATLRDRLSSVTPLHLAIASPYHHYAAASRMSSPSLLAPMPPVLASSPATAASAITAGFVASTAGAGSSGAVAPAPVFASPLDVDAAFALFVESQRKHKDSIVADLRSRSVLHRYQALQQQQQKEQQHSASSGGAAASALSPASTARLTAASATARLPIGGAAHVGPADALGTAHPAEFAPLAADGDAPDSDHTAASVSTAASTTPSRSTIRDELRGDGASGGRVGAGFGADAGARASSLTFPGASGEDDKEGPADGTAPVASSGTDAPRTSGTGTSS